MINKKIIALVSVLFMGLHIAACGQTKEESITNRQESSDLAMESTNPETFPAGVYYDDINSELIITKMDDKKYKVTFGIYKLEYMENADGTYDSNSGILSFSGTDDTGKTLSADVVIKGENLIVTLTHSEYGPNTCPAGTEFEFKPAEQ